MKIEIWGKLVDLPVPEVDSMPVCDVQDAMVHRMLRDNGTRCDICNQLAKIYPRHMDYRVASSLLWLIHFLKNNPIIDADGNRRERDGAKLGDGAPTWLQKARVMGRLLYWGLADEGLNQDGVKERGCLTYTTLGLHFASGLIAVPETVCVYNDTALCGSDNEIYIHEALQNKDPFDFDKMMRETFPYQTKPSIRRKRNKR